MSVKEAFGIPIFRPFARTHRFECKPTRPRAKGFEDHDSVT